MLVGMSAEPSGPAVVAFGAGDAVADGSWPVVDRLRRVIGDRRLVAVVGMVQAGVAACGALVAPWYSVVLPLGQTDPTTGAQADRVTAFHLTDLGTLGTGYLLGLLVLAVASVLVIAGPPAARSVVRLVGLTVAAGSLAMVVALTVTAGNYIQRTFFFLVEGDFEVDNRSGVTAAFLSVILVGLALLAAGRAPAVDQTARSEIRPEWGWQPPRPVRDETAAEIAAAEPLDLTVQPSRPFVRPDNDDDRTR